jgi:hypothetical protein
MGLHLAEGSLHAIQGFSAYLGYRTLRGMAQNPLNPIPAGEIFEAGHFIDHEFVHNLEADTQRRLERLSSGKPLRILISVGGAGAQQDLVLKFVAFLTPYVESKKVAVFINIGDHKDIWQYFKKQNPDLEKRGNLFINDWGKTKSFAVETIEQDVSGFNVFQNDDIFEAVYTTNLLMRATDVMITKPSELAFYPVPKLLIKRIGGHEAWGAIRSAELGDGTVECSQTDYAIQMLKLMITEKDILALMNDKILKNKSIGIYSGGYNAVKMAVKVLGT